MRIKKGILFIPEILIFMSISGLIFAYGGGISEKFSLFTNSKVKASSILNEKGQSMSTYAPEKAFDNDPKTAWCEGKTDSGIGESIHADIEPTALSEIFFSPGIIANRNLYNLNNRIKDYELEIFTNNGKHIIQKGSFKDDFCESEFNMDCKDEKCFQERKSMCSWGDELFSGKNILIQNGEYVCVIGFTLKIISVYPGLKYNDTCISEIGFKKTIDINMPTEYKEKIQKKIESVQNNCN